MCINYREFSTKSFHFNCIPKDNEIPGSGELQRPKMGDCRYNVGEHFYFYTRLEVMNVSKNEKRSWWLNQFIH